MNSPQPCTGTNCGTTDGLTHSPECQAQHAAAVDEQQLLNETRMTGMHVVDGGVVMGFEGGAAQLLAEMLAEQYRAGGGTNYIEMRFASKQAVPGERFLVTVQRVTGKTPNELQREAEFERDQLSKECEKLRADRDKSERRALMFGDILHHQILAMRAAVVDGHLQSPAHGMQWIVNTLEGPGHLPNLDEARTLGGAQALFDKEVAEQEAFRAAHPAPDAAPSLKEDLRALQVLALETAVEALQAPTTTAAEQMQTQARAECGDDHIKRGIFFSGWLGAEQAHNIPAHEGARLCTFPKCVGDEPIDGTCCHKPQAAQPVALTDDQVERAAKTLAASMDYPWEPMPEQGRERMRANARSVIKAARPPATREHVASANCWCGPTVEHHDPETGAKVYVHRDFQ